MKKQCKKLALGKETLRQLEENPFQEVAGGLGTLACYPSAPMNCPPPSRTGGETC
jgi:hypothetical protein